MSALGSVLIKTTLIKSLPEALWYAQIVFLSKQVLTTVAGRWRDAQAIVVPGAYTLLTPPGAKRPGTWLVLFLENMLFITVVDLIQQKKLDSWNFYESNLTEARFNSLLFY